MLSRFSANQTYGGALASPAPKAGLTIGQSGQMAGASSFWGLALEYPNTPLLDFHLFRLFTTRQNCRAFQ